MPVTSCLFGLIACDVVSGLLASKPTKYTVPTILILVTSRELHIFSKHPAVVFLRKLSGGECIKQSCENKDFRT